MNNKSIVLVSSKGEFARYKSTQFNQSEKVVFAGLEVLTLKNLALSVILPTLENKYHSVKVLNSNFVSVIIYFILKKAECNKELKFFKDRMITLSLSREIWKNLELLRKNTALDSNVFNENLRFNDLKLLNNKLDEELEKLSNKLDMLIFDESKLFKSSIDILNRKDVFLPYNNIIFKKYNLNELSIIEKEFLTSFSNRIGSDIDDIFLLNTYEIEALPQVIKNINFSSSYGIHNEIHGVIKDILEKQIQFSDAEIIFTNNNELKLAKKELERLKIPYKSTLGNNGLDTEEYSILKAIFDIDEFEFSPHRAEIKLLGYKSYKNYKKNNKKLPSFFDYLMNKRQNIDVYCKEFIKETISFISECFDSDVATLFVISLNEYVSYIDDRDKDKLSNLKELVMDILGNINIPSVENIGDSYLLLGALSSLPPEVRENVYILGLDSNNFKSSISDSPILTDSEKLLLGVRDTDFNMSKKIYNRKERKLLEFLSLISNNKNLHLTLSYVSFDSVNIKEANQSSFYMRLKSACGVYDKDVKKVDFASKTFCVDCFNTKNENAYDKEKNYSYSVKPHNVLNFSASIIDSTFMECPKKFYFNQVLKIKKDEEETSSSGVWLEAKDKGLLIHEVLSNYVNKDIIKNNIDFETLSFDKNMLKKVAKEISNKYSSKQIDQIEDIPLLNDIFNKIIKKYFNSYPCKETVFNEGKKECKEAILSEVKHIIKYITRRFPIATEWTNNKVVNICGLNFEKYRIDRIDYDFDKESLVVIDYKIKTTTGVIKMNKKRHGEDTLRQDYIYSYIVDEIISLNNTVKSPKVSDTIYRFVLSDKELPSLYNDEAKSKLFKTMEDIIKCCKTGEFEETSDNNTCNYCDYKILCKALIRKNENEKEEEIE